MKLSSTIPMLVPLARSVSPSTSLNTLSTVSTAFPPLTKPALEWATDNLIKPETDQVILLNVRPFNTPPMMLESPFVDLTDEYERVDEECKKASHELIKKVRLKLVSYYSVQKGCWTRECEFVELRCEVIHEKS
jgi:hypothetical protein